MLNFLNFGAIIFLIQIYKGSKQSIHSQKYEFYIFIKKQFYLTKTQI